MQQWIASRMSRRRWLILAGALLALFVGGAAYLMFGQTPPEDEGWARIQQTGTLRVGMDASYPPFESIDPAGQPAGLDVDLSGEIARRWGIRLEIANIAYDGLYDALATSKVDVIISALADLPQSRGKAAFSLPYFNAGEMMVVRTGSPIRSMDDMNNRTVAVEYGSGGDVEARKWQRRLQSLQVKRYQDSESATRAVSSGEADAALVDGIAATLAVGHDPALAAGPHLVDTLFAAAVPADNDVLHDRLDQTIQQIMQDGTLGRLIEKWFGPQRSIPAP